MIDKQLKEFLKDTNEVDDLNKTENKTKRWKFANEILYDMCKKNPKHEEGQVIVAKIWLIGRSYAAAIERTKEAENAKDFYYEKVVPKVLNIHDELDRKIAELDKYERLSRDNLDKALEAHKFLINEFHDITGQNKRSLASKYLHFHCPSMFYIYDTRAGKAINKTINKTINKINKANKDLKRSKIELHKPGLEEYDKRYADFCAKALALQEYIEKEHGQKVTPRDIDNFLLYYCD